MNKLIKIHANEELFKLEQISQYFVNSYLRNFISARVS